jgi:predicted urease superfamily metal-dependent hydrolase
MNPAERFLAQRAVTDEFVTILVGIERVLRVIEVQHPERIEAEDAVERMPRPVEIADQVVSRGVQVAGIGTIGHAVAHILRDRLPQLGQFLEPAAPGPCQFLQSFP